MSLPAVPADRLAACAAQRGASAAERRIVLSWLVRLRWLAVVGQIVAIGFAVWGLGLDYPVPALAATLAITLLTNAAAAAYLWSSRAVPAGAAPAVLLLDVALLTALLYLTGGTENPFAILYAVHVAMAAVVLPPVWAWATVAVVCGCYGLLSLTRRPFLPGGERVADWASVLGRATALLLVVGLIAYFIGRIRQGLRRREEELARVRERAQANERLAAVTSLAAGAAHELGTPLATIAVVAKEMELAARKLDGAVDLADDAALVRQQVDRCRAILEHLRGDVAGRTTDEPGTSDPARVAANVQASLAPDRGARLDVRVEDALPPVAAPPRATEQAVQLLVNNAFDATASGRVVLDVAATDGGVALTVRDRGEGMDPDTLRRATDPFFTTKDPGRGMGLGLFLVRLVAERNGGSLAIDSHAGRGTTATLRLPRASE